MVYVVYALQQALAAGRFVDNLVALQGKIVLFRQIKLIYFLLLRVSAIKT